MLLRATVGTVVIVQAGLETADQRDATTGMWVAVVLAIAAGISLFMGLLTPVAAGLVSLGAIGVWTTVIPTPAGRAWAGAPSVALLASAATALVLLGPGAFSIDARLFGWREIIIPPRMPSAS